MSSSAVAINAAGQIVGSYVPSGVPPLSAFSTAVAAIRLSLPPAVLTAYTLHKLPECLCGRHEGVEEGPPYPQKMDGPQKAGEGVGGLPFNDACAGTRLYGFRPARSIFSNALKNSIDGTKR